MAYLPVCNTTNGFTGIGLCGDDMQSVVGMIFFPRNTSVAADESTAQTLATYTTFFNNVRTSRAFSTSKVFRSEIADDEEQQAEGDYGQKISTGTIGGMHMFHFAIARETGLTAKSWKYWRNALNSGKWDVVFVLKSKLLMGLNQSGTVFKGIPVNLNLPTLQLQKADDVMLGTIELQFENVKDFDNLVNVDPTANFNPVDELIGTSVEPVTVEAIASSEDSDSFQIKVLSDLDGRGISDLVVGDFTISGGSGSETITETSTAGTYTVGALDAATTYTINLAEPTDQTTGGYESVSDDVEATTTA